MATAAPSMPTAEEEEDVLLACRYGDIDDVLDFVARFGPKAIASVNDENGNTVMHMIAANGHADILNHLLPLVPSLLSAQNTSGSTPLHWAALNAHYDICRAIVECPQGPGISLIDIKNAAGRTPLGEAELAGWDEGAQWLVEKMSLDEEIAIPQDTDETVPTEESTA